MLIFYSLDLHKSGLRFQEVFLLLVGENEEEEDINEDRGENCMSGTGFHDNV